MAKRRKSKGGSRRRRIGAMSPASNILKIGAVAAGYFLASKPVNDMIDNVVKGKLDNKIVGAGQTGLGAMLLLSRRPSMIKTVAGGLAAGTGLKRLVVAFNLLPAAVTPPVPIPAVTGYGKVPVIGGYQSVPVIGNRRMNGYTPSGTLGAYAIPSGKISRVMGGLDGSSLIGGN